MNFIYKQKIITTIMNNEETIFENFDIYEIKKYLNSHLIHLHSRKIVKN